MSKDIKKPFVLIGLMGAGKTSVGALLAEKLGVGFFDVDRLIVEREGCSIADLFTAKGEGYFRDLEKSLTIETIHDNPNSVISIGGGAFINDDIRAVIKTRAISVFLKADLETLLVRVGDGAGRPLLESNPSEKLQKLIHDRYAVYQEADISVASKDEPLEETVNRVIESLYNAKALT